jgi:hypothetical protein
MKQDLPVLLRSAPDETLSLPAGMAALPPGLAARAVLSEDSDDDQLPAARGLAVGVGLSALLWMPVALAVWTIW